MCKRQPVVGEKGFPFQTVSKGLISLFFGTTSLPP